MEKEAHKNAIKTGKPVKTQDVGLYIFSDSVVCMVQCSQDFMC